MEDLPFYKKPGFWVGFWIAVLIGLYAYQFLSLPSIGSVFAIVINAIFLLILFPLWTAFYAQFILPINTLEGRSKIINRLNRYRNKTHGPALFIQNGRVLAKEGELERRHAGVIWLDTASAAVTRSMTSYMHVLGPGVHFTEDGEYLAGSLDLHTQVQTIGPKESDLPFEQPPENADEHALRHFKEVQERRTAVSALTRDGIEIVPSITVVFKLDAQPSPSGWPGSHFGFDENAAFKAISKEGINPQGKNGSGRVAWNQLPALIAADLWREFAAKFTFDQFFEPSQLGLPDIRQPDLAEEKENIPLVMPVRVGLVTGVIRYINRRIEGHLDSIETQRLEKLKAGMTKGSTGPYVLQRDQHLKTAFQVINQMMKLRMTQALVPVLDESGRALDDHVYSEEYRKLQERGLRVIGVSVGSIHLPPDVHQRTTREWNANWLVNAQAERERIDRRINFIMEDGKRTALRDYAIDLSRSVIKARPTSLQATLVALLERSRSELMRDDRLRRRLNEEPPKKESKEQGDLAPALMSILQRSGKEQPPAPKPSGDVDSNIEVIDQIIERTETNEI